MTRSVLDDRPDVVAIGEETGGGELVRVTRDPELLRLTEDALRASSRPKLICSIRLRLAPGDSFLRGEGRPPVDIRGLFKGGKGRRVCVGLAVSRRVAALDDVDGGTKPVLKGCEESIDDLSLIYSESPCRSAQHLMN